MNNVCAIVVTYNRKDMLVECIEGLMSQSQSISKIFIVDNASTDGTEDLLKLQPWFKDNCISYNKLEKNTGGAGGFNWGLKKAHEENYDWYWCMDDDVEPDPLCLEKLLEWKEVSQCLHPRRYYTDNSICKWECYISPKTGLRVSLNDISFSNGRPIAFTNTACFEGMLVSHDIINKIGYPDAEYFIVYDDTVYGMKASMHTAVGYVANALMVKKINKENVPLSPFYIYYSMRNFNARQRVVLGLYNSNSVVLKSVTCLVFVGHFVHIVRKCNNKMLAIKSLLKGAWDGWHEKHIN